MPVNVEFRVSEDAVTQLLTRDELTNEVQLILKIKKPDYLGDSRWEFRHQHQTIEARILDEEWLAEFRRGNIPLRPRDALRAIVRTQLHYGFDGEVIHSRYEVVRVLDVIHEQRGAQTALGFDA